MQLFSIQLTGTSGWLLLVLTLMIHTAQGGKCEGAWKDKHFCISGNGKRSGPQSEMHRSPVRGGPLSDILYGSYAKRRLSDSMEPRLEDELSPRDLSYDSVVGTLPDDRMYPDYLNTDNQSSPSNQQREQLTRMWQRVKERLLQEKAREVYADLKQLYGGDQP